MDDAALERVRAAGTLSALTRAVVDGACVATLQHDTLYEWVTFTGHRGGHGAIRKLVLQSGAGE